MDFFSSRDRVCESIYKQIWLLCVLNLSLNSLRLYGIIYVLWHLFILNGCEWSLDLNLTELTMWICLNDMHLSLLYVDKYGGFVYLTST
jgi:hypothetical protein